MTEPARLRAVVLGDPIAHSRSPKLHGFWLKHYGIAGSYEALHVPASSLAPTLTRLMAEGYAGCNLTVPHKEAALPLMDELDEAARAIGAVNTVLFRAGRMLGRNTDAHGFIENLRQSVPDLAPYLACAVILGAGGAARAGLHGLKAAGARDIWVVNRTRARADALAAAFGVKAADWSDLPALLPRATLLANATTLGMQGSPALVLPWEAIAPQTLVTDMVYAPLRTELLQRAEARGCMTVDGLGMLLHQAAPGFAAWFGVTPEVSPALRAAVLA